LTSENIFIRSFAHSFNLDTMSKKLGFNISDLLAQPVPVSVSPTPSTASSSSSSSSPSPSNLSPTSTRDYHHDRQIELNSTLPSNETNHHLSNYEQLMRASSIYRNHDYSLLPIVNGTYPWIQTDSILKDRFSCKFIIEMSRVTQQLNI